MGLRRVTAALEAGPRQTLGSGRVAASRCRGHPCEDYAAPMSTAIAAATDHRRRMLRRMAQVCLGLVVLIVVLSAFMRHHGAGVGCADWPACYGQAANALQASGPTPAGDGVALARLGHRVAASLALVLILVMLFGCLATRPILRREGRLAAALLVLALGLAALGVVSAGTPLPAVVLGNLLGGFLMLALCARMVVVAGDPQGRPSDPLLARMAGLVAILLVGQFALGALVSATWSAPACSSFGDCLDLAGRSGWDPAAFDPLRVPVPGDAAGATVQLAHRVGAIVAAAGALVLGVLAWRRGRRGEALALAGFLLAVLALGALIGGGALSMPAVLLHNLGAAGVLATVLRLP